MAKSDALIKVGIDIPASEDIIEKDLKTLAKDINSKKHTPLQVVNGLSESATRTAIQKQVNSISKNLKLSVNDIDVGNLGQKLKQAMGGTNVGTNNITTQLFNSSDLDKEGRKYFSKTTDIIKRVKDYYLKNGAVKVDLSSFEKAN